MQPFFAFVTCRYPHLVAEDETHGCIKMNSKLPTFTRISSALCVAMLTLFAVPAYSQQFTYECHADEACDDNGICETIDFNFQVTIPPTPSNATLLDDGKTYTMVFEETSEGLSFYSIDEDKFAISQTDGPSALITATAQYFGNPVTIVADCPTGEAL
ncbi:hypothetical protein Q4555_04665 [Octadecabacter sp. 1_MG-2023]|uniref:hypothetical protein n=1 Tax=unclassified Octadecabacter TaxID=196158 RepID=UPI001C09A1EC|nr:MULTISPECIES: hypothetical protein [unclassified Octadecabacter]MBU2994760.1 hypothetical protein [Octadecabacter sp. B2R22]MDO6733946.1 hypothetical protein [Octadecabacter sp. 1_MG-2023]